MKTLMPCLLRVVSVVLAIVSGALMTSSCTDLVMFQYLDRKTQLVVDLPCADYCPPTRSKDADIFFCYKNCRSFVQCQLSAQPNVLSSLEQRRVGNVAGMCITDTWFFHPKYNFTSCQSVCSGPDNMFCLRNCPDFYYNCVSRLAKPNRTSITAGTGGVQQSTTAAAAGSNTSTAAKSTTSTSVVSSQTPSPEKMLPSSSGHSYLFLVTVIVAVVLIVVLAVLIICLLIYRRRSHYKGPDDAARLNPDKQDTNRTAATHCRLQEDSSLCTKNPTRHYEPLSSPPYDPNASGLFDLRPDYEDEKMLSPRV